MKFSTCSFLAVAAMLLAVPHPSRAASLVFSELMYNPLPSATNAADADDYEFLELYNTTAAPLSLGNATFTAGITYTFPAGAGLPAGAYGVLVSNRGTFTNRYPAVTNILGQYSGKLADGGETVTLKSSAGVTLFSVTYSDAFPWPKAADGHGVSLVLSHAAGDPNVAASWAMSDDFQGSPGGAGSAARREVVINEVIAHTDSPDKDAIELFNGSTSSVSVLGWYLSDDPVLRRKYRLTNAVAIPPGGYLKLDQDQFHDTNNPTITPFALSELGDEVYLTAADAQSNLTRAVDIVYFDATDNGVSLGRWPNGAGELAPMLAKTLGASNSGPRLGPVVISEIMYHPADDNGESEFVELLNISNAPALLYDAAFPTNRWKLMKGVDYTFPTNVSIPPGGRLIVTGATNPATFRATYNLATNVPVYGPWAGKLDNAGEIAALYKPGVPEANGFVPDVLVERVSYLDTTPWPLAADGGGPALERLGVTHFADTADNWFAGPPNGTPGFAPVGGFVNPQISPASPAPGQVITATVSLVAATLPTQVVMITAMNDTLATNVMVDNGTGGDAFTNDQKYTTTFAGPPAGAWVYQRFVARGPGGEFVYPAASLDYAAAPVLTVRMSLNGLLTTAQVGAAWTTYATTGTATHATTVYAYLGGAGEIYLDDVSLRDVATGAEHVQNGGFDSSLTSSWFAVNTHAGTFREQPDDEPATNHVLHVVATGVGSGSDNGVYTYLWPTTTVGAACILTFRARQVPAPAVAWSWFPIGAPPPDVVMNEIMYHAAGTHDEAYDYVELYNPASVTNTLTGWELKGAGFVFPTGAVIRPSSCLVSCASQEVVRAAYGITNTVGNWSGTLQNGGETVRLMNRYGRELDRVTYDDAEPWPVAADGYGPALERLHWALPGTSVVNWAASMAPTNWQTLAWTGLAGVANADLRIWLDAEGKCRVDDVSVKPLGDVTELATNGTFESGTNGWQFLGNHGQSRVEAGLGVTSNALVVVGNLSRWVINGAAIERYGDAASNAVVSAPLATAASSNYGVSLKVLREGLGGNVYAKFGNTSNSLWLGSAGTPGRTNSVTQAAPVGILGVTRAYDVCPVGTQNTFRVAVAATGAIANVQLRYRAFGTNGYQYTDGLYLATNMTNAGNNEYVGVIPGQTTNLTFVRYHVRVQGTNGHVVTSPRPDDPSGDYGYWVESTNRQTVLPNWQILADGDPVQYPIAARACAVSPQQQVFVDARVRHRGNPSATNEESGVALRVNRGNLMKTWFAKDEEGINFKHRGNGSGQGYRRVINEPLAYDLQKLLGFPAPRFRHVCAWFNGKPTITVELEDPEQAFLTDHGIPDEDFVSRTGWSGESIVGGNPALNNRYAVYNCFTNTALPSLDVAVRTNLVYESVQHALALLSITANGDQHFAWNMFQHRRASDLRWQQYPWDVDFSFDPAFTNLHPYYATALHPNVWDGQGHPLPASLFYPETNASPQGLQTLPYRHRQQMTLWRYCGTLFTTHFLFPRLDALQALLAPAYLQIGVATNLLAGQVGSVKSFIAARSAFYRDGAWSDKDASLWNPTNTYTPTNVVVNELMIDPPGGGEYLELYNRGGQAVDLSQWTLSISNETYRLPFGAMLGPTSYLVIADSPLLLTNYFTELADSATLAPRYPGTPVWDWPIVFTAATEYASRIVELPKLTLPNGGATVTLLDWAGTVVDTLTYAAAAPWPTNAGVAIELRDASTHNALGGAWQASSLVGTPGWVNTAASDRDGDGLPDAWEQRIVDANPADAITNAATAPASGDFDGDGIPNGVEFVAGTDPTTNDVASLLLRIGISNAQVRLEFDTAPLAGDPYWTYAARLYTLNRNPNLLDTNGWGNVTNYVDLPGTGAPVIYTHAPDAAGCYRYQIRLVPRR
jgi:hypothetical protein